MFIYSYNTASQSYKLLRDSLGIKGIKHENSKFKGKEGKVVINWGASSLPDEVMKCRIINHPEAIKIACDKREFFKACSEFSVPFTTSKEEAIKWLEDGKEVVIREKVNGHSGEGITIIQNKEEIKDAPLYTMYVPKKEEYRIHVFRGNCFFIQKKARKLDVPNEDVNWKVRNLDGGFIFTHENVTVSDEAKVLAISCVKNCGLDFGAVDILWNAYRGKYYALEINTAPGIQGTTLEKYVEVFNQV